MYIMSRVLFTILILLNVPSILSGQDHPDLGLNGVVTWIDNTHIRVEYDWSDDSQLLDWDITNGSTMNRQNGFVTINGGTVFGVWAMIWKQEIRCSRITSQDASSISPSGHLNFYSNLSSYIGNWLPDPGLGAVLVTDENFWTHDGVVINNIGTPFLETGVSRDYDFTVSQAGMTIKSSADNVTYSYNAPCNNH